MPEWVASPLGWCCPLSRGSNGLHLAGGDTEGTAGASQLKGPCPHTQEQTESGTEKGR